MRLKFKGTFATFSKLLEDAGIHGDWAEPNEGCHLLKHEDGTVSFWPSKGTVLVQGKPDGKARLEGLLASALGSTGNSMGHAPKPDPKTPASTTPKRHIFVVHGHDGASRDQLELALRRLGLEPFILMNSTGGGKTIIEALEGKIGKNFSSDFGIALFTPDDMGYASKDGATKAEPRARQNVVLETGMLLASLTRERMAILVKGHVDLPSDLQGVIQFRFNDHVKEIMAKLANRMIEAGVNIDTAKIAEASY